MRVVVQRVSRAQVTVDNQVVGAIGPGLMLLVGIRTGDTDAELQWMAEKVPDLRIFPDEEGKMNRSLMEAGGAILAVSQFTLYGDCKKGRRPSFIEAAPGPQASPLFDRFVELLRRRDIQVETGIFGADMQVELVNDGPVTLIVERESE